MFRPAISLLKNACKATVVRQVGVRGLAFSSQARSSLGRRVAMVQQSSVRAIHDHHHHHATAAVQHPAPAFSGTAVVNEQFKSIKLSDYHGKWLVFFFYPLDFTFVCPTEIIAFSDRVQEFKDIGCEVVACSVDSQFSHLAWVKTARKDGGLGKMNIPLLADITKEVAHNYGVLTEGGVSLRGLFIIDPKGTLRQMTVNDLPVGRSVDETLRLVKAFQFVEKHGEVCPANWKPGQASMKADPEGSKEYFSKHA